MKFTRGERCAGIDVHGRGFAGRLLIMSKLWTRMALTTALAGGLLLVVGAPARADRDWGKSCHERLEADRARIDKDVAKHGENSRQVDSDVQRMDNNRKWCRDHRADWDHGRFDIGIYIHK
jgi:hypothetical protein